MQDRHWLGSWKQTWVLKTDFPVSTFSQLWCWVLFGHNLILFSPIKLSLHIFVIWVSSSDEIRQGIFLTPVWCMTVRWTQTWPYCEWNVVPNSSLIAHSMLHTNNLFAYSNECRQRLKRSFLNAKWQKQSSEWDGDELKKKVTT